MREAKPGSLRLFLHIGLPKTGSTSIQMRFFENAAKLKERGYLYPLGRFQGPVYQHSALLQLVTRDTLSELASSLRGIHDEAVASNCHTVILSGETLFVLSGKRLEWLRQALAAANFSPTVVVFFRPLLDYARSLAAEHMRSRQSIVTPSKLALRLARHDEGAIVARFASAFGAERVISHELTSDEDCVALFDKDIGLVAEMEATRQNPRFDFATLNWLNAIQSELGIPTGVIYRLYWKAFSGKPPLLASEAAFMSEVADLVGGEKGDLLRAQLKGAAPAGEGLASIESQVEYVENFSRFVSGLRRHLRRKAIRRAVKRSLWRLLGREDPIKNPASDHERGGGDVRPGNRI